MTEAIQLGDINLTVIVDSIDPLWHEELLTISLLNQGDCSRGELRKRIRWAQERKVAPFPAHSNSAYNYWFRALKQRRIIIEYNGILSLTNLGHWIAAGKVGGIAQRNQFAYLVCELCSNQVHIVLRTPLISTLRTNSGGNPFMDIKCPKCGKVTEQYNLGSIANREEFASFYNKAVAELGQFVKLE